MKNTDKIYAEALYESLEGKTDIDPVISGFLSVLKNKSQLHRIDKIIREFEKLYNQKNNVAKLKIKSAYELETQVIDKIANALGIATYELETELDKDLIGGFVAQYNDNLIDLSFKNNLNKLSTQLKK